MGEPTRHRNWTAIGIGLEVLASVAVTIEPLIAIPIALLGAGAIIYGLAPKRVAALIPARLKPKLISVVPEAPPNTDYPDWPIRDLFFHIDKDCLETIDGKNRWEIVGRIIRDKLSTGQLRAWGRPDSLGSQTLRLIGSDYWSAADWTYWFFAENTGEKDVMLFASAPGAKGYDVVEYKDVQVNKAEALAIWPVASI